jgi:hypothetical protein
MCVLDGMIPAVTCECNESADVYIARVRGRDREAEKAMQFSAD